MDYWPSYIPKPSSLSESVDDPYIEATSETGDDAARVRYSKERQGPTKLTWKIMRLGDFVALKQFYAEHRAIEFLWLHPSRGLTYKTRFVSSPISSSEDGKSPFVAQVEVTLQIVELAPTEQTQPSVDDLMATVNEGADRAVQAAVDAGQARDAAQEAARQAAATAAEIPAAVEAGIERIETAGTTQIAAVEAAGTEQVATVKAEGQTQTAAAKAQADAAAASAQEAADRLNEFKDLGATATTLAAGSDATASFNASTGVLTIGVPKGDKGDPGATGELATDDVTIIADAAGNAVAQDIAVGGDAADLASARGLFDAKGTGPVDCNTLTKQGVYSIQHTGTTNGPGFPIKMLLLCAKDSLLTTQLGISATGSTDRIQRLVLRNRNEDGEWGNWAEFFNILRTGDGLKSINGILSVPEYEGATASSAGVSGLVPPAAAGEEDFVLHGDGTYRSVTHSSDEISAPVYWFGFPADERSEDIAANTLLTVPRYQVGSNSLFVFLDNGLCTKGESYEEVGEDATVSTQIKLLTVLKPYHELKGYVISTIVSDKDPSAVQRIAALESQVDSVIPLPVGFVAVYAGTDEPLGWRRLDGQSIVGVSSVFPDFKAWAVDDGHAVLCTLEEYETELATYEGQCGKFGWDAATDTLRLPTISAYIRGATSVSEIGTAMQSGLPDFEATIRGRGINGNSSNGSFMSATGAATTEDVTVSDNPATLSSAASYNIVKYVKIKGSLASPIYGRSPNSVTPPSVRYPYIIKVADAVYPPSVMDARKVARLVSSLREEVPGMAAHAAGPSEQYIDFSLPEKEGSYTAPADGWIALMAKPTGTNAILQILVYPPDTVPDGSSYIWRDEYATVNVTQYAYLKTRVSKGQVAQLNWGSVESFTYSRFIYSSGNAPA